MNKRSVGSIYEQLAAEQLINMGYSVLACNYRNRFGEIDIIAKDGDTICFCEVKYRRDNGCGRALEAVGYSKQKKIISVARYYLMKHGLDEWTPCRFDVIADGTITIEKIESSDFYNKIEQRVHFLPLLEQMIDSNDTVFKYNKKANMYSMIEADYLMENNVESRNLFLFLSNDEGDNYFCRSFFPEEKMDYSKNQASWTLLYKKKIDLSTRIETVLYNRIK